MTDEQLIDLGQRAFACKGWRWMPGMRAIEADPEMRQHGPSWERAIDGVNGLEQYQAHGGCIEPVPDFRDPATLGGLLALVREAWGDLGASVWHDRRTGLWSWMAGGCIHSVWRPSDADGYPNEAAALVAALEACNGA